MSVARLLHRHLDSPSAALGGRRGSRPEGGVGAVAPESRWRAATHRGFSLIELLIAVAIIMIIIAIAIPSVRAIRQNTLATAAASNLKTLSTVLSEYATQYPAVGYPPTLTALGPPANGATPSANASGLVDETLAKAATVPKQNYIFTYTPASGTPCSGFTVTANPQAGAATRYFYLDQDGSIRYSDGAPATASSPVLQ